MTESKKKINNVINSQNLENLKEQVESNQNSETQSEHNRNSTMDVRSTVCVISDRQTAECSQKPANAQQVNESDEFWSFWSVDLRLLNII